MPWELGIMYRDYNYTHERSAIPENYGLIHETAARRGEASSTDAENLHKQLLASSRACFVAWTGPPYVLLPAQSQVALCVLLS